ncbi:MAG TPA: CarD family transcriptional regulator [Clostridiales bacterium]|nr:CarD family transcriptional regulator [Clostridiales bacterium]
MEGCSVFKINDYVIYGMTGVCKIIDIENKTFGDGQEKLYYVLKPVYTSNSKIFAPADSEKVRIRKLLSSDEIYALTLITPDEKVIAIKDDRLRNDKYSVTLKNGNITELVKLLKTLYFQRDELNSSGKKLQKFGEKIMKEAEKMLYEEFAVVINLKATQLESFLKGQINL